MKIAFIHYHLKTGGVTTVLKQQLHAVSSQWETLVLTGLPPETPFPARIVHIPELGYSSEYRHEIDPDDVAQTILKAIERIFEDSCDVLHVHNPTLAKNRHFIKILKALQKRGANLLLQIHDFAEDGRPHAYFAEDYPADCHYGVINGRDYELLLNAGLKGRWTASACERRQSWQSDTAGSPAQTPGVVSRKSHTAQKYRRSHLMVAFF